MSTDQDIKKDVVDELYWDTRVDAADVKVEVHDRCVTLSGTVPTYLARRVATDDVSVVAGVEEIRNDLKVRHPESIAPPSDEELQASTVEALDRNPDINIQDLVVEAEDGRITLAGTVNALWKRAHAEEVVSMLRGVAGVTNLLAVVPTEDASDQRVAEHIMGALERNAAVDAERVSVEVRSGHVRLTGAVPHWAARDAATRAVYHTEGVRDVENRITVAR